MTYLPLYNNIKIGNSENIFMENDMINILAGLSFPMKSFPNTLYNSGYIVSSIEKSFRSLSNQEVKFDIVLNSQSNNRDRKSVV